MSVGLLPWMEVHGHSLWATLPITGGSELSLASSTQRPGLHSLCDPGKVFHTSYPFIQKNIINIHISGCLRRANEVSVDIHTFKYKVLGTGHGTYEAFNENQLLRML